MTTRNNSYPGQVNPTPIPGAGGDRDNFYDGSSAGGYTVFLSKENIPVVVNPGTGVSDFTGAICRFHVYLGNVEETSQWTLSAQDAGVTSSVSGNTLTITGITDILGFVDATLTKGALSITRRVNVYNVFREGESAIGVSAPSFYAQCPVFAIPANSDGSGGVFTYAVSQVFVTEGGVDTTEDWTIAVTDFTAGITYTFVDNILSVTASTVTVGVIELTASKLGMVDIIIKIPVIKCIKGTDGADGADGIDGADGTDGTDGITPVFDINSGNLRVSFDGGDNWSILGAVVGTNGADGTDGVSPIFRLLVGSLEVSYDAGDNWETLGGVTGADGDDGVSSYQYIAYASDASGTDFTLDPAVGITLSYLASLTTSTYLAAPVVGDFAGLWRYFPSSTANVVDTLTATASVDTPIIRGIGLRIPHLKDKVASASSRHTHSANAVTASATYVKLKTITFTNGLLGSQRFNFDMKTSTGGTFAYGRIYRNGVALGTEQSTDYAFGDTFTEDITQDWNPGDTCELWGHCTGGVATVTVYNFEVCYDDDATQPIAVVSANT